MYSQPTHDELVNFRERYPSLSGLLATFIEGQEEEMTIEESLQHYLNLETMEYQHYALTEGRSFLEQRELPWTIIRDCSNIHQATEEDARAWLSKILDQVEQSLHRKKQLSGAATA